jgi:hypothetical protein
MSSSSTLKQIELRSSTFNWLNSLPSTPATKIPLGTKEYHLEKNRKELGSNLPP